MYTVVAIAGTFDHLHKGHEKFITAAFDHAKTVLIGLTSDKFAQEKLKGKNISLQIQSFSDRKKTLENFLKHSGFENRFSIVEIDDVYGPSIQKESHIQALVVTSDTMKGAQIVNDKRKELGLSTLEIIEVSLLESQDLVKISSTKIREGEIDREGVVYKKLLPFDGKIPETLRQKLKEPQGELIKGNVDDLMVAGKALHGRVLPLISSTNAIPLIVSIGDEVTKLCNELSIPISIGIVDLHVNRKRRHTHIQDLKFNHGRWVHRRVVNPPGTIKNSLVEAIYSSIHEYLLDAKRTIIEVEGEEDLAGLPAILMAPLGSIVLYGQPARIATQSVAGGPAEGIVIVRVEEITKQRIRELLSFEN